MPASRSDCEIVSTALMESTEAPIAFATVSAKVLGRTSSKKTVVTLRSWAIFATASSSFADGTYGGNPMGFLIESSEGNFYYAGDTALTYDMKLIGEYKSIDFAFLPIGNNFTMGIDNALIAAEFINCQKIIGMHYDTFGYIKIDTVEAAAKFQMAGNELHLFTIGETKNI